MQRQPTSSTSVLSLFGLRKSRNKSNPSSAYLGLMEEDSPISRHIINESPKHVILDVHKTPDVVIGGFNEHDDDTFDILGDLNVQNDDSYHFDKSLQSICDQVSATSKNHRSPNGVADFLPNEPTATTRLRMKLLRSSLARPSTPKPVRGMRRTKPSMDGSLNGSIQSYSSLTKGSTEVESFSSPSKGPTKDIIFSTPTRKEKVFDRSNEMPLTPKSPFSPFDMELVEYPSPSPISISSYLTTKTSKRHRRSTSQSTVSTHFKEASSVPPLRHKILARTDSLPRQRRKYMIQKKKSTDQEEDDEIFDETGSVSLDDIFVANESTFHSMEHSSFSGSSSLTSRRSKYGKRSPRSLSSPSSNSSDLTLGYGAAFSLAERRRMLRLRMDEALSTLKRSQYRNHVLLKRFEISEEADDIISDCENEIRVGRPPMQSHRTHRRMSMTRVELPTSPLQSGSRNSLKSSSSSKDMKRMRKSHSSSSILSPRQSEVGSVGTGSRSRSRRKSMETSGSIKTSREYHRRNKSHSNHKSQVKKEPSEDSTSERKRHSRHSSSSSSSRRQRQQLGMPYPFVRTDSLVLNRERSRSPHTSRLSSASRRRSIA